MGRYAGFISLHAALASGDVNLLLLPEMKFDMDDVIEFIQNRFKTRYVFVHDLNILESHNFIAITV